MPQAARHLLSLQGSGQFCLETPLFVHESPANILANKCRKPETLIIRQRQTHSNKINNKVPFQRSYSMCLPVASAMKNKMGPAWRRQEEMTPLQTTSCGQSVALGSATTDI